jgi:hypothetical protein
MHTDPDAPLIRLLSIKHNPLLVQMNEQQLREFVIQLRARAEKPAKKTRTTKPKPPKEAKPSLEAQRQAIRDAI